MGMKFFIRRRGRDVRVLWTPLVDGHERAVKWLVWPVCGHGFKEGS